MPSPVKERPGLLVRDPFQYSESIIIIPPLLAHGLRFFNGEDTELDLQAYLSKITGEIVPGTVVTSMVKALEDNGFLDGEGFNSLREKRHQDFASAPTRMPIHAGTAYPSEELELVSLLKEKLGDVSLDGQPSSQIGIAAPHVSPDGGWSCYSSAYRQLPASHLQGRTIVILGTSHYGAPERFGLTRKPFRTPLGELKVNTEMVDWLEDRAGKSIVMEDYCHAIEHSIEFQCVFLRHLAGNDQQILPILCGPFVQSMLTGESPEKDDSANRFFDALGELNDLNRAKLIWVLGIDLAHIGPRYGDADPVRAFEGEMESVEAADRMRLECVMKGDDEGFLALVQEDQDPLKWCGFSPLYTFLKAVPEARGTVLEYDQWNIDETSVVSFASLNFNNGSQESDGATHT